MSIDGKLPKQHTPAGFRRATVDYVVHRPDGTPDVLRIPAMVPFEFSAKNDRQVTVWNSNAAQRDSRGEEFMIFADVDWLPVNCWCETEIVGVPQQEVAAEGLTRSCGRPGCRNPETGEQIIGNAVTNSATTVIDGLCIEHQGSKVIDWGEANQGRGPANPARTRRPAYPAPQRVRQHARYRPPADEIEIRRDLVEMLWREGKSNPNIALELNITVATVDNDVRWLRAKGVI